MWQEKNLDGAHSSLRTNFNSKIITGSRRVTGVCECHILSENRNGQQNKIFDVTEINLWLEFEDFFSAETSDSRKYRLNQHKLPVPGQCHKILSLYPTSNASAERAPLGFAFKRNAWWGTWVKDINNSLHLAQKYARIFLPRTLSVPRGEQFSKSVNCELWVRNRWLIFAPNRGYLVLCL